MKILIVCNNAYNRGNGLCTAILKHCEQLSGRDVQVRLMASENPDPNGPRPDYELKHFKFPFFEKIIASSGFRYAKTDRKLIEKAVRWADVVHLEEAFPLEITTARIAAELGKPCVGTFHLYTENIMANLGMRNARFINHLVTQWWRRSVYDKCRIVQCPAESVREHLARCGFKSELRVISNGIDLNCGDSLENIAQPRPPYTILCIGRLSNEKSQDTLLEAMKYSRHAKEIRLVFAGKGPKEEKYRSRAAQLVKSGVLVHEPTFGFYDHKGLSKLAASAYLYVHCAWVEIEGLSCLEALRSGAVPVIAEGPQVATSQFALDEHSKFPVKDAKALAERIDWWIEHPQERARMSLKYAESVKDYDISKSTDAIIKMYQDAIEQTRRLSEPF